MQAGIPCFQRRLEELLQVVSLVHDQRQEADPRICRERLPPSLKFGVRVDVRVVEKARCLVPLAPQHLQGVDGAGGAADVEQYFQSASFFPLFSSIAAWAAAR